MQHFAPRGSIAHNSYLLLHFFFKRFRRSTFILIRFVLFSSNRNLTSKAFIPAINNYDEIVELASISLLCNHFNGFKKNNSFIVKLCFDSKTFHVHISFVSLFVCYNLIIFINFKLMKIHRINM